MFIILLYYKRVRYINQSISDVDSGQLQNTLHSKNFVMADFSVIPLSYIQRMNDCWGLSYQTLSYQKDTFVSVAKKAVLTVMTAYAQQDAKQKSCQKAKLVIETEGR